MARSATSRALHCSRPCASGVWEVEWERADGTTVPGLGFGDMLESANPGVIVVQEWWGITPEIQLQAQKIADDGFRVMVPDLCALPAPHHHHPCRRLSGLRLGPRYRGEVGVDAEEAAHLMDNLDWMGAVEDISSAADTLAADGNGEVAVVGFCMGGALSLASAALVEEIDCAIAFYGIPPKELADMATLAKPVQGHFGNQDAMEGFSCPAAVDAREPPAPLWPPAAPPVT